MQYSRVEKKKEFYRYVNVVVQFSVNFILGLKFIFLCLAYGNEFKTNWEIQIKPRIKLSHNINISESNFLKHTFTPFGPRYLQLSDVMRICPSGLIQYYTSLPVDWLQYHLVKSYLQSKDLINL